MERLTDDEFKVLDGLINHPLAFRLSADAPSIGATAWALIFKGCAMVAGNDGRASLYATAQGGAIHTAEVAIRQKAAD